MSASAKNPPTMVQSRLVNPAMLRDWLDRGEAALVDVREPDEVARERLPGADVTLLPLSRFDPAELPATDGRKLVLVCRTGSRSAQAAEKVIAPGSQCQLYQLEGGIEGWKAAGFQTQVERSAPLPIMQQVQITAGSLVVLGVALGAIVSPWFLILSAFVGGGLIFAGASSWCGMAKLLGKMPWNRRA